MFKLLVLFIALYPLPSFAQHRCCELSPNEQFAALAMSDGFLASHPIPPPFAAVLSGSSVILHCADGKAGGAYFIHSEKHSDKMILLFHEFWGLNDYIKSEADRISNELGVSVLAVDLYDGKVGTTREEAGEYMRSVTKERATALINAAIQYAGNDTHIGTIGWCFGGGWSLQTAILAAGKCDACVMYYGQPELDQEKLSALKAPVLGIFGSKDHWLTPKVVADFQAAMKTAHKSLTIKSYDADHGFANPSNPNHDKIATADAWSNAAKFFTTHLRLQ